MGEAALAMDTTLLGNAAAGDGQAAAPPAGDSPPAAAATPPAPATPAPGAGQQAQPGEGANQSGQPAAEAALDLGKIQLPEGVKLDEQLLADFKPIAEAAGIKQEQAQQLVELFVKAQGQAHDASLKAFNDQVKAWGAEVLADKEYGGANLPTTMALAGKAIRLANVPGLGEFFTQTGLGNHPLMVKALANIGKLISSDSTGGASGQDANNQPKDMAEVLFGKS